MILRVLIISILLFMKSNVLANTKFFKEGVNLFNTWRAKTISEAPQVAIVPAPT